MESILFVCLANICRSPAAEAVMKKLLVENDLAAQVRCDSAGISAYHAGAPADARMREQGKLRGFELTSISRPIDHADIAAFDMIIAMDNPVYAEIKRMSADESQKLHRFGNFCQQYDVQEVPDPYAGGKKGFIQVFDIIEDGCRGLLAHVEASLNLTTDTAVLA